MLKLSEILARGAVVPALRATEREEAIAELVDALVDAGASDRSNRDELVKRIVDRERLSSTGFGRGVAIPHAKHKSVKRVSVAIGLSPRGLDFSSLDRKPVHSVFLLLSPDDCPEEHLQAMDVIFRNLDKDAFRRELRQAGTVEDVRNLLAKADNQHLSV